MNRYARFVLAAFVITGLFWIPRPVSQNSTPTRFVEPITNSSAFIYRAYLDKRSGIPRLKILALNRCHRQNESILQAEFSGNMVGLEPIPIEGGCPWNWADGCILNAYVHEVHVPEEFQSKEIKIEGPQSSDVFPIHTVEVAQEEGITVCVPPLYWYTDWTKLILFVEWWRKQQVSQFIFYHQSSTEHVRRVLDYYVDKGWAEVVPWPMLTSSQTFEPNNEVYRLAHSLAHNDCLLRTKTQIMTLVDIDELIQPTNSSLSDFIYESFAENSTLGSILFPHRVVLYNPPLAPSPFKFEDVDFSGIGNAVYKNIKGPPKAIVRTNAVERMSTHKVNAFRDETWGEGTAVGAFLLHNRYNYVGVPSNHTSKRIDIVSDPERFQPYMIDRKESIFPTGADFKEETQRKLGHCLSTWRSSQGNCKALATACRQSIVKDERWSETTTKAFSVV